MKSLIWDGRTKTEDFHAHDAQMLIKSFVNMQQYKWQTLVADLAALPEYTVSYLINTVRPENPTLNTLLHEAARYNAPVDSIEHLIDLGASRYQRNAQGQNALDIAQVQGHEALYAILQPVPRVVVSLTDMQTIEEHIYTIILNDEIAALCINDYALCLPQVAMLLESDTLNGYFPVPEYLGGFSMWLDSEEAEPTVYVFSASRMDNDGDSARLYRVTPAKSDLLAKGREVDELYFKKVVQILK
jgi:hypothetical protein